MSEILAAMQELCNHMRAKFGPGFIGAELVIRHSGFTFIRWRFYGDESFSLAPHADSVEEILPEIRRWIDELVKMPNHEP